LSSILNLLAPIQHGLEHVVMFLYSHIAANYGIVIILLTLIVRLILTPLTISQTRSMAKMQKIQPALQELQKKYKDDKQKLQQETMEFYKKNNVNPLAGCLPLLFQLPVFFALYQVLRSPSPIITNVLGTPFIGQVYMIGNVKNIVMTIWNTKFDFLWMNLNQRDPFYILAILMVATMFISTKLTTTDPKQKFITYLMPLVFGVISFNLPAGILVYWNTTNLWSIGQQWIVNRIVKRERTQGETKTKELEERKKLEGGVEDQNLLKKKKKRKKRR
jgi:YidC/Oxa1 family membrane protein insertase